MNQLNKNFNSHISSSKKINILGPCETKLPIQKPSSVTSLQWRLHHLHVSPLLYRPSLVRLRQRWLRWLPMLTIPHWLRPLGTLHKNPYSRGKKLLRWHCLTIFHGLVQSMLLKHKKLKHRRIISLSHQCLGRWCHWILPLWMQLGNGSDPLHLLKGGLTHMAQQHSKLSPKEGREAWKVITHFAKL